MNLPVPRSTLRLGAVVLVAAIFGLVLGIAMPRGPMTTGEGLIAMALGAALGAFGGLVMGSRWAMLVMALSFVAVFELVRIGEVGPTVDWIHLSTYGLLAFITGRGLTGALVVFPMLVAVPWGIAAARRWGSLPPQSSRRSRLGFFVRRAVLALSSLLVVLLAVLVAKPATTDPILGPDGEELPGSIAELTSAEIGGHDQDLMIRGNSEGAPVLLVLAGGPGGSEIGSMRNLDQGLEEHFVVATWDQRGTGKSADEFDPPSSLGLDQGVNDTIEVTNYLRERFDERKIYVLGNSWGTIIGVLAVKQHPELYHAYVGSGQMANPTATDRMFYEDTLAWAESKGDDDLIEALRTNGPPPYDDLWEYEPALSHEHDWNPYPGLESFQEEGEMPGNLFVEEYTLVEKFRTLGGFMDVFSVVYPQLDQVNFRRDVPALDVPVYLVQGKYEARGRAIPARKWFEGLTAPTKRFILFERSGHKALFEEPDRFQSIMADVLADTYRPRE